MYQDLYGKAANIIKKDACMKCYDISKPLNLDTDTPGISLGGWPLAGKEWYELWVKLGSGQHSIVPYCISKQKHIQCGVVV